jgi:hypothetical protein
MKPDRNDTLKWIPRIELRRLDELKERQSSESLSQQGNKYF